jgi:hypothetical protein
MAALGVSAAGVLAGAVATSVTGLDVGGVDPPPPGTSAKPGPAPPGPPYEEDAGAVTPPESGGASPPDTTVSSKKTGCLGRNTTDRGFAFAESVKGFGPVIPGGSGTRADLFPLTR